MIKLVVIATGKYYLLFMERKQSGIVLWSSDTTRCKAEIGDKFIVKSSAGGSPKFVDDKKLITKILNENPDAFMSLI